MKVTCRKCGHHNPLGHVFCIECGDKLDLTNVSEDMERSEKTERQLSFLKYAWIPPLIAVVIIVGLACWPYGPLAEPDPDASRDRVEPVLGVLFRVSNMRSATLEVPTPIKEADINHWIEYIRPDFGVDSLTLLLTDNTFCLRVIKKTKMKRIGSKVKIKPLPYSYDITGRPDNGGIKITGARFGHMPLPGPAKSLIVGPIADMFAEMEREQLIFSKISDIRIGDGEISLTVTTGE